MKQFSPGIHDRWCYLALIHNRVGWERDYSSWGNLFEYSEEITVNSLVKNNYSALRFSEKNRFNDLNQMKRNFDYFYDKLVSKEDIEIIIYFPPYSSLWWYLIDYYNNLDVILSFKEYVLNKVSENSNIKIFDLQYKYKIVDDLNNYKDLSHFNQEVSDSITGYISENSNVVHTDSYLENTGLHRTRIKDNYYPGFYNKVKVDILDKYNNRISENN